MSSTWMEQKPNRNDNRFLREDKSMKNMMIVCVADAAIRRARSDARCPGRVVSRDEALADPRFADIFFFDAVIFNTDREVVG